MTSYVSYIPKADAFKRVRRKKNHFVGAGPSPVELVSPIAKDVERARAALRNSIKRRKPSEETCSRSVSSKRKGTPKRKSASLKKKAAPKRRKYRK